MANNNLQQFRLPPPPQEMAAPYNNLPQHFENLFLNGNFADDDERENNNNRNISCWVFGYGSLCWYPGFEYDKCITGYIRGYNRRFWQGNTTHRGTADKVSVICVLYTSN